MSDLLTIFAVGLIFALIGVVAWWLIIPTEGVYLGRRAVIWLYDRFAHRYDGVKNYYREYEQMYLAQPIMESISPHKSPLILDVATGTVSEGASITVTPTDSVFLLKSCGDTLYYMINRNQPDKFSASLYAVPLSDLTQQNEPIHTTAGYYTALGCVAQ